MDSSNSNSANDILLHLVFDHAHDAGQAIENSNITVADFDEIFIVAASGKCWR